MCAIYGRFVFSIALHPVTSISPFCIIYLLRYLKSSKAIQLSGKRRRFQCKMSADVRSWLWWGTCRGRSRWPFVEGVCWSEYSKLGPNPVKITILCDYPISQPVASCPTHLGRLALGLGQDARFSGLRGNAYHPDTGLKVKKFIFVNLQKCPTVILQKYLDSKRHGTRNIQHHAIFVAFCPTLPYMIPTYIRSCRSNT